MSAQPTGPSADNVDFDVFACPLDGTRLIEASAGTGKTWSLAGLYLRLLLERGLPVAQILVVTFTKAAVAELRDRIRSRIAETLQHLRGPAAAPDAFIDALLQQLRAAGLADELLRQRLELALQQFDEAAILTIHGFCQRALAEAPFSSGMPLQLEALADDSALRLQVVRDFWRRRVAALPAPLAAYLLERKDSPESMDKLLQRRLAKPLATLRWPAALDALPALPDEATRLGAFAAARANWDSVVLSDIVAEALPRLNGTLYKPAKVAAAIEAWRQLLSLPELPQSLAGFDALELLGSTRLQPKKGQAPAQAHPFFAAAQCLLDAHEERQQVLQLQRLALLRELLDEGPAALRRLKRAQRVLGFDDMLLNLYERLQAEAGTALARRLRQLYAAALIDEFQDTDPLQYGIFRMLFHEGDTPLFLVGDPKQAIYGFRSADLPTYLRARADARQQYTLAANQRSSAALLRALNALFGAQPNAFMLDGLAYTPVHAGTKQRPPLEDRSGLPRAPLQLWQLPAGNDGLPTFKREAMQQALQACAAEIARLLAAAQRGDLRLGERALAAGDIAVLVRSHAQGAAMRRALSRLGVGSVELSQASVFDSSDAADLACVLAAMLEPQREALLRAALATEAMGRDAAAIAALAQDEAALLDAIARFAGYRDRWLRRGIGPMLREWLRAEGVSARLLARPDGERRMTNLLHLAELLHEASQQQAAPDALLRWLQAQRGAARRDDAAQLRLESDRNLVQIVTIHKSKGLEYPLVFCPLLWDGTPERGDGQEPLETQDADGGTVFDFSAPQGDTLDALKQRAALQRAAETMRLIYVALTRAVHRCHVVVGSYRTRQGKNGSTSESGRARLHWLVAGAGQSPAQWLAKPATPEQIAAAWHDWATRHAPDVALDPLPDAAGRALPPPPMAADPLAALPPPAALPRGWWIGSYSSLAHGTRHDGAAVDHDLRVAPDDAVEPARPVAADDILRFPRGAVAGECLHAVFEGVDFDDPQGWPQAVARTLQRYAPALPADADAALHPRMLLQLLHDVLHTPLPDGLRLAEVPAARRLVELEFHLPARHLDASALQALLRRLALPAPALGFGTLEGYLRGFIDLVFEHGGRYYLLDWKSNHLGDTPADYAAPALAAAMARQGYHLQALLYALALHRHLQQRLPGYRHDVQFGGVFYLFVRGVRPHWHQPDGTPTGVHFQRPTLQALQQLGALLDGERR